MIVKTVATTKLCTTCREDTIISEAYDIVFELRDIMETYKAEKAYCEDTDEVIEIKDLERVLGILDGIQSITELR